MDDTDWGGQALLSGCLFAARVTGLGRLRSLAIGCFREAQLQGLHFGDEPSKAAGMSRPIPAHRRAPKLSDDRPGCFTFRVYEAVVRGLRRSATSGCS